jgi:N,N'-diacetyllegionaminate synthase
VFLSTPFDKYSVDLLDGMGMVAFKVGSGELTNLPFLTHIARKGKPMILSTGMANLEEVGVAVDTVRAAGNRDLVLLHCVSNYPSKASSTNLRAMKTLEDKFEVPVGYSDHTEGIAVALASVALGACLVEKHFTLDRNLPGPDHPASIEPAELAAMVRGIRMVQSAIGDGIKQPASEELNTAEVARRSLVVARDLRAGSLLTADDVVIRRPGTGLPPALYAEVIGRRLAQDVSAGSLYTLEMLA